MTFEPFFTHGASRSNPWLITCDHANNTVPDFVNSGDLGLAQADMQRHIAYDIGAAGVTRALADILDAPAILSNFSRLVIDPNRGMDDPTLLMKLYDGTIIPGNRTADDAERQRRINGCYTPYHTAYETLAKRPNTVLVSIHSFTPPTQRSRPAAVGNRRALSHRHTHGPALDGQPQCRARHPCRQ